MLSFDPLDIDRLAAIDSADCEYETECVDIQGVVSPRGQGGWSAKGDLFWGHAIEISGSLEEGLTRVDTPG